MYNPDPSTVPIMLQRQPNATNRRMTLQHGVSLIELMIGITIGLLVVVAALGTLSFTQVSSTTVNDSVRLQQKATSAFRAMGFQARQAGGIEIVAHPSALGVTFSESWTGVGGTMAAVGGIDGGAGVPDTLQLSYQDNGITRDCLGNLPVATAGDRVDTTFSVVGGRLQCTDSNGVTQVLIDGVEDFQVSYGAKYFQTASRPAIVGPIGTASQARQAASAQFQEFSTAAAALALAPLSLNGIPLGLSVTICLQLRGDIQTDAPPVAMQGCSGMAPGDGFVRRVYRNTIGMRATLL